ncbi:MAG: hypothetical protein ACE5DI_03985 [Candidatus Micrarchaeia archaeon]
MKRFLSVLFLLAMAGIVQACTVIDFNASNQTTINISYGDCVTLQGFNVSVDVQAPSFPVWQASNVTLAHGENWTNSTFNTTIFCSNPVICPEPDCPVYNVSTVQLRYADYNVSELLSHSICNTTVLAPAKPVCPECTNTTIVETVTENVTVWPVLNINETLDYGEQFKISNMSVLVFAPEECVNETIYENVTIENVTEVVKITGIDETLECGGEYWDNESLTRVRAPKGMLLEKEIKQGEVYDKAGCYESILLACKESDCPTPTPSPSPTPEPTVQQAVLQQQQTQPAQPLDLSNPFVLVFILGGGYAVWYFYNKKKEEEGVISG